MQLLLPILQHGEEVVFKSTLPKSAKNQSCRDALPPKNTVPKTNETSNNAHQKACTDYTHHSAMHLPRSYHPYIFPTTPTQSVPHPYSTAHPILLNTHHRPQSSPSTTTTHLHPTSLSTIISYILHKTQYPTLQPTWGGGSVRILLPCHKLSDKATYLLE